MLLFLTASLCSASDIAVLILAVDGFNSCSSEIWNSDL